MKKTMPVFALIFFGFLSASAYAGCNPASTCYVQNAISALQSQITSAPAVGQSAFGGVIFYVDYTGQHGLVAASTDEPGGANYTWGLSTTAGTAQYQCANKLAVNGFGSWFLPNQAQMTLLYVNRYAIDPSNPGNNGGFSNSVGNSSYWTSTVSDFVNTAWSQSFSLGIMDNLPFTNLFYARCIRSF